MDKPNNGCYVRVYVSGETVPVTDLGILETDVFGNTYYNLNKKFDRINANNDTVPPESIDSYNATDFICTDCTGPEGIPLEDPHKCMIFDIETAPFIWKRRDINNELVTEVNPNEARGLYVQRDHIRTDINNKPIVIDCKPKVTTVTLSSISISDWEFVYDNGMLIARESSNNALIEPEENTVIYV